MKMKTGLTKKLKYGGVTAALTAAIIAIIILVNIIFSALAQKHLWYTDLTPELFFTLSENAITLMKEGDTSFEKSTSPIKKIDEYRAAAKKKNPNAKDKDIMINIIFCNDELTWKNDTAQRYVLETAKQLRDEFPDYITIEYVDIIRNPTAVTKYGTGITTSSVIIECKNNHDNIADEFRVRNLKSFYVFNTDDSEEPWAYNGEKIFAASILAVTRADTPIACFTTRHGETLPGEGFLLTLVNAGYDVMEIDLSKDEIPENCRLMIISSPKSDFIDSENSLTSASEIDKIEDFLDGDSSLMVFMEPTTTRLTYLEDFLEEWGIKFDRVPVEGQKGVYEPYIIQDNTQAIDPYGYSVIGNYLDYGLGGEITKDLRTQGRRVVFPSHTTSISYSDVVTVGGFKESEDGAVLGDYGYMNVNNAYREIFDVFVSSDGAIARVGQNSEPAETAKNGNNFKLMTITVEDSYIQESNYTTTNEASYVIATGCSAFAIDDALHGSYGNNSFLEYTLRIISHEPVPVGLTFKPFGDYTIDTITKAEATQYTVAFTVTPLLISLAVGIVVIVRRKNR